MGCYFERELRCVLSEESVEVNAKDENSATPSLMRACGGRYGSLGGKVERKLSGCDLKEGICVPL